jgi:hypothetical protein
LGVFLSPILVMALFPTMDPRAPNVVAPLAVRFGWALTVFGLVLFRRKTRAWKISYDATYWKLSQAELKIHPARARYWRLARRVLIFLPGALAVLVLFFVVFLSRGHPHGSPSSRYMRRYRIPIPWSFVVIDSEFPDGDGRVQLIVNTSAKGRFGMTPFPVPLIWSPGPISLADFGYNRNEGAPDPRSRGIFMSGATEIKAREFRLGDGVLTCLQYRPGPNFDPHYRWWGSGSVWYINCGISAASRDSGFHASFAGREQDIPAFYEIVAGVRPVN